LEHAGLAAADCQGLAGDADRRCGAHLCSYRWRAELALGLSCLYRRDCCRVCTSLDLALPEDDMMPRLCAATGDGIVLLDEAGDARTEIAFWHPTTYVPSIQRGQKRSDH